MSSEKITFAAALKQWSCPYCGDFFDTEKQDYEEATVGTFSDTPYIPHVKCPRCKKCMGCFKC
jgi:hypothetical protein